MAGVTWLTAASLRAVLCYIDPENTPKISYDREDLVEPLIDKVKKAVGDHDGSEDVYISFGYEEAELERQFFMVCSNVSSIFNRLARIYPNDLE